MKTNRRNLLKLGAMLLSFLAGWGASEKTPPAGLESIWELVPFDFYKL